MVFLNNVETRVVFMGEPKCGKRSLLHYYIFDQIVEFEVREADVPMQESEKIEQQDEFVKELHIDNKTLNAHFFVKDIPAEKFEEFSEKTENYDCYVILFDMGQWPESGHRARALFNRIQSHKKLMVGCKSDLFTKNRKSRTHCVPCSVVHSHNIDNVFDQVTEILQFQDVTQQIALRTPRTPRGAGTRTTPRTPRGESMPDVSSPKKNKNVKKLFRAVTKLRSNNGTRLDDDIQLDSPHLELPKRQRGGSRIEHSDEDPSPRRNFLEDFDADAEVELPDDFLDNCDEKSLLGSTNTVNSKQLLQEAWKQNVKSFASSLGHLKSSGANFNICQPINSGGDSILHELVRRPGWVQSLQVLLQSNVLTPNEITQLVNTKNHAGNTALHIVAARGHDEYLSLLLKSNIDVQSENERGKTALFIAIEMNKKSIVKKLVETHKELLNRPHHSRSSVDTRVYDIATELGYWDIAEILQPHFKDSVPSTVWKDKASREELKSTFFSLICEDKETEQIFEMVKEYPFLVHETDTCGRTPLHMAVLGRPASELPELLLARDANINQQDNNGNTSLHWAASHPCGYSFGKYLIQCNANIDVPNHDGNFPLHMAVFSSNFKLLEYMLNSCNPTDAGIRKANADENTPLHIACAISNAPDKLDRLISLMTEKRAETNAVNSRCETPLHIAAAAGCIRIHPSLCDQLDARDIFGNTPLLAAARAMNLVAVQNLLDMGSSLESVNKDNENLLHLLAFSNQGALTDNDSTRCINLLKKLEKKNVQREIIRQLLNRTTISTNEIPLFYAVGADRFTLSKFYVRRGDPKSAFSQNITGNTPLHVAVRQCNRQLVDYLIRKEAVIHQQNKEGFTPLHFGCSPSHNAIADRLLKKLKFSDLCIVSSEGLSVLHLAAQAGNLSLVQKLVEKNPKAADSLLSLKTQHDNTALIYAMSNNHSKVASYLAKKQGQVDADPDIRIEFRKEPFPHLYPFISNEKVTIVQKMDIFSPIYNIFAGTLQEDNILILEANGASSAAVMAHEVAIMSMIGNHPNIQRLLGASANKYCYLPFLPNATSLEAILNELIFQKETCDILQVLTIAEGIANGMKCLHSATVSKPTIIHNSLSPRAILVDDQNAKLSSFGAARVHFSEESEQNDTKELPLPSMDEVRYLAPEVLRGQAPTKKSDVFSFGIILWQLCTAKVPFAEILMADMVARLRKDVHRPSLEGVDKGLSALISDCWSSNPQDRPSFEEVCDRLNSVHVKNVEALGRNQRAMPLLRTKASPFPCCKPNEFQIMNKLRKRHRDRGHSALYLCTFERIVCVVKMWPPNLGQQEQTKSQLQIFTMKSLCESDDIVRYIYSDTDKNGNKCLFMEYMNKGSVAQLIADRNTSNGGKPEPFSAEEIILYALPIARALKFMHKFPRKIVHQDIQAENILITNREGKKDVVKLSGFSSMHSLQQSEEHEVYRDLEGFALYLYQLLTLTTRVKNNWKSQLQKLHLAGDLFPLLGLLHSCLDPIERPTSTQLVERIQAIQGAL